MRARKRADEGEGLTEKALEMIGDVFFVFDLDGRFMKWNGRLSEVTGYSDDEIAAMRPVDLFAGDDAQRVAEAIGRVLELDEARVAAHAITKGGRGIPYEFTGSLLKDQDAKPYAIAGIGRDISERMRAEEEIHLRDTAIETSLSAMAISDMSSNLTYVN